MPAPGNETEVIKLIYDVDPSAALRGAKDLQRAVSKSFKLMQKSEKDTTKGLLLYTLQAYKIKKMIVPAIMKEMKGRRELSKVINQSEDAIADYQQAVLAAGKQEAALIEEVNAARQKGDKDAIALAETRAKKQQEVLAQTKEHIAAAEEQKKQAEDALKTAKESGAEATKKVREKMADMWDTLPEAAKESGERIVSPLKDFMSKDAGALFDKSVRGTAGTFNLLGKGFGLAGAKMLERAKAKEAAGKGAGGGLKAMGGFLGKLGGILGKFGPIIEIAGAFMQSFIKILIDAEAAAKDFNKQILSTAGTSEFLHANMKNAAAGAEALDKTLKDVRDGSMSLANVQWGISKETASNFITAITGEGVSLLRLGKETERTTGYAKDMGKVTQMSVAYSRAWGVSLSEIGQLQGEMMSELGMNLTDVQTQFQYMTKGAEEAGIATNKFFGIIRTFSSDLSLFTTRMEDVTQVMMALGKVMSPREASKFLQTLTQTYKGMDLMSRVKAVAIGGTKGTKDILQKDLANKIDGLGESIENTIGTKGLGKQLANIISKSGKRSAAEQNKAVHEFIAANQDMTGEQKSAILDASRMQGKLASGNMIDIASALKDAGPMAIKDVLNLQSRKMFGKPLEELTGVERIAAGNAIGQSDEQIDALFKLERGIEQTQVDLVYNLEKGHTLTDAQAGILKKMGYTLDKNGKMSDKDLKDLKKKTPTAVWNAMGKDSQEELKNSTKEINYQERIADQQTSIVDKLGMIFEVLQNQLYNVMQGIWKLVGRIASRFFGGPTALEDFQMAIDKLGSTGLSRAVSNAPSIGQAGTNAIETVGKEMVDSIKAAVEENKALEDELKEAKPKRAEEIRARQKELAPLLKHKGLTKDTMYKGAKSEEAIKLNLFPLLYKLQQAAKAAKVTLKEAPATGPAVMTDEVKAGVQAYGGAEETTAAVEVTNKAITNSAIATPAKYEATVTNATLEALRKGLYEHYLYSRLDPNQLLQTGMSGAQAAQTIQAKKQVSLDKKHAAGGLVTSIVNGKANVARLPVGEGWTSIGKGERIIPAGGGGGGGGNVKVELQLKGDLGRFVDARVVDGTAEFHRNRGRR